MASVAGRSFTIRELEKALRLVDSDVVLVRQRLLQRVIRQDGDLPAFGVAVPHRQSYVLDRERLGVPFAMRPTLLRNEGTRFRDVAEQGGAWFDTRRLGRGLAVGDLDNDGRIDLLIVSQDSPAAYFHNRTPDAGHFLTLRLEGTRWNRDAIGAVVRVYRGDRVMTRPVLGMAGYLAQSSRTLHFGLGDSQAIDRVEITWPGGTVQRLDRVAVNARNAMPKGGAFRLGARNRRCAGDAASAASTACSPRSAISWDPPTRYTRSRARSRSPGRWCSGCGTTSE